MMMNSIHRALLVTLLVLLLNTSVGAADRNQERSVLQSSEFTNTDQQRANLWRLSKEEWQRYKTLMEGVRGSISPNNISPIGYESAMGQACVYALFRMAGMRY